MATYRKRGSGWHVQIRRQGHPSLTRTFRFKDDAKVWARQVERELDRDGITGDQRQLKATTLADLLTRYRDTISVTKRGCEVETIRLNCLLRHRLATLPLSAVRPAMIAKYRDERLAQVRPDTVLRELGLLHRVFEVARREWDYHMTFNPVAEVKRPKASKARERRLEGGELDRLVEAAQRSRNCLLEPFFRLAIETGMRRGELLNLRWSDIDLQNRTLHIPQTKNGHARTIPVSYKAIEVLSGLDREGGDQVFPLSAYAVRHAWNRLTKRAGIADLHFHDLRHEAISRFFEKGLSVAEVALISGHRDFRQLFRYTHLRAEDVARKL